MVLAGTENTPAGNITPTIVVDFVNEVKEFVQHDDREIMVEPLLIPSDLKMIVRHPDGNIFEYIEPK